MSSSLVRLARTSPRSRWGRRAGIALCALALLGLAGAGPAAAQSATKSKKKSSSPPASIAPAGGGSKEHAQRTFDSFAREWMAKMDVAARQTAKKSGSGGTLRGYGKEWTTEIKPTGSPSAPFVGLLRYVEEERSCKDAALMDCRVTSTTGVTEIFRFQGGKWVY